jgi:hypothetical protein
LLANFAEVPRFDQQRLQSAVSAYAGEHDLAAMSWSQQLATGRGCFATLLAAKHDAADRRLALFGVGDSVVVPFERRCLGFRMAHRRRGEIP